MVFLQKADRILVGLVDTRCHVSHFERTFLRCVGRSKVVSKYAFESRNLNMAKELDKALKTINGVGPKTRLSLLASPGTPEDVDRILAVNRTPHRARIVVKALMFPEKSPRKHQCIIPGCDCKGSIAEMEPLPEDSIPVDPTSDEPTAAEGAAVADPTADGGAAVAEGRVQWTLDLLQYLLRGLHIGNK